MENTNKITLGGKTIEQMEELKYMGSIIDKRGGSDANVRMSIGKSRTAFLQSKSIWNSNQLSVNIKVRIFIMNINTISSIVRC